MKLDSYRSMQGKVVTPTTSTLSHVPLTRLSTVAPLSCKLDSGGVWSSYIAGASALKGVYTRTGGRCSVQSTRTQILFVNRCYEVLSRSSVAYHSLVNFNTCMPNVPLYIDRQIIYYELIIALRLIALAGQGRHS